MNQTFLLHENWFNNFFSLAVPLTLYVFICLKKKVLIRNQIYQCLVVISRMLISNWSGNMSFSDHFVIYKNFWNSSLRTWFTNKFSCLQFSIINELNYHPMDSIFYSGALSLSKGIWTISSVPKGFYKTKFQINHPHTLLYIVLSFEIRKQFSTFSTQWVICIRMWQIFQKQKFLCSFELK